MKLLKVTVIATTIVVTGCGPTKWDLLREAESRNQQDLRIYCDKSSPDAHLCARAKKEYSLLQATREQYRQEAIEECRQEWASYERKMANYDRKLAEYDREMAEYDRELERHEREKDRKERECDREEDRYDRDMDRYYRCLDRKSSDSYAYCSRPTMPFCMRSLSIGPTKPSKPYLPRQPSCTL